MATYNLRRFSNPETLKQVGQRNLLALLEPHAAYFASRGPTLPKRAGDGDLDYERLVEVFMTPGSDTPRALANALFLIDEMATPEAMDGLLDEARILGIQLGDGDRLTPADVAVRVWLQKPDVLAQKHAEQILIKRRSFEYFQTDGEAVPEFFLPSQETVRALEAELDEWFEAKKRGRGARVFVYPKDDGCWFLVRHGDPYKREGSLQEEGKPSSVFYRPEKYDVLCYNPTIGEIRINARSEGEKDLYRKAFGRHVFGSEDFFPGTAKYTLEPLRTDGPASLVCTDVDGMEWVRLVEVHYFWGGGQNEVEIRKADDIFVALEARETEMPGAKIIRARFKVKFADARTPRTLVIRPSNIADYQHDADSVPLEEWLTKRGFTRTGRQAEREDAEPVLAGAQLRARAKRRRR